jgi:transcriptional regulator with XRE-family HTH domain
MSRRRAGSLQPIARRLRFVRGDATQEEFAKRVGVSRSAIANYETGRSIPDDFTLARIVESLGFPSDYFASNYDPLIEKSLAGAVGAAIEGIPDWTEDEATLVRILRLCDQSTIADVIKVVAEGAARQEFLVTISTIYTVNEDLQRLFDLGEGKRPFQKGSLATYPEGSALHSIGFKTKSQSGPQ